MNKAPTLFGRITVKGHVFPITGPYCLFGSADGCDIRIKGRGIQPTHCQIEFNKEREAFLRCFHPIEVNGKTAKDVMALEETATLCIDGKEFIFAQQIQRSNKRIKPVEEARRFIRANCDPEDLYWRHIDESIGRGVFAKQPIGGGRFLCDYKGVLSRATEVKDKDTRYTFFFQHKCVDWCIDAANEPRSYEPCLARLINHADTKKEINSRVTVVEVDDVPHLAVFAIRDIQVDEEIRYDYGVKNLPWTKPSYYSKPEVPLTTPLRDTQSTEKAVDEGQSNFMVKVFPNTNSPRKDGDVATNNSRPSDNVVDGKQSKMQKPVPSVEIADQSNAISHATGTDKSANIWVDKRETNGIVLFEAPDQSLGTTNTTTMNSTDYHLVDVVHTEHDGTALPEMENVSHGYTSAPEVLTAVPIGYEELIKHKAGEDDLHSSDNYDANNYDSTESEIDDSDMDPDYAASSTDETDDDVDEAQKKLPELTDYVSDSDCSTVFDVQSNSPISTTACVPVPTAKRSMTTIEKQKMPCVLNCDIAAKETISDLTVFVPATTAYREDGRRNVDKKHCCTFCGEYYLRIGRHLQTHVKEQEIQLLKTKPEKERDIVLTKLRLDGDFKHNLKVRETGIGHLILPRRPGKKDEGKYSLHDYKPCEICKGFFLRWELWRHMPKCPLATEDQLRSIKDSGRTMWQQRSHLMMESAMSTAKDYTYSEAFLTNIVAKMKADEISLVVRNDSVIMKLGEEMFEEKGAAQKKTIKQKMRLLGRLVLQMRKNTLQTNANLECFLKSNMFDFLVDAAKDLSGKTEGKLSSSYQTPSVALKLGPALNECCALIRGRYLRSGDEGLLSSAQRLQQLINDEWDKKVTSIARRSRQEFRRNKQVLLPKASDLGLLNQHISKEIFIAFNALQTDQTQENYQRLSSLVLVQLIVFNRRRSGETSNIFLSDYQKKPDWHGNLNDVVMSQLSVLERKLVHRLDMIMIRGKRERNVSVILIPEVKKALNLLVRCRDTVGINAQNPYLFPRSSGTEHIAGHFCIRNLTKEIPELEFPERIYSTNLRKFTATIVQMLNLNAGEIEWLSNHLGHTVDVHKEYYRNQESAVELGKIASMLMQLDNSTTKDDSDSEDIDDVEKDSLSNVDAEEENDYCETLPGQCHVSGLSEKAPTKRKSEKELHPHSSKKKKVTPWSEEQLQALKRAFVKNIRMLTVPNKMECEKAREKEKVLQSRDLKNIKFRVHHEIQRLRKK